MTNTPANKPETLLAPAFDDEAGWQQVAGYFPSRDPAQINLEHGYFGAMAAPVQAALDAGTRFVNEKLSPYVRGEFASHVDALREQLAHLIHAERDEILLTRSASESMQVLIGQYHELQAGDAVLWSNLDYPAMRHGMQWLEQRRGVTGVELRIELPISGAALLDRYLKAIQDTPNLKLILLSQVYPCNGQRPSVREIIAAARAKGIDVLLDSAHALGQVPLDVQELGVDFAGFNLHKWIGAPLGLGFTYIRKSRLASIEAHFGCQDFPAYDIRGRLYAGTPSIGAVLAVPAALAFHERLGGTTGKFARLAYLRRYWMSRAAAIPGVRLFSPRDDEHASALGSFTVDGLSAQELQEALLRRFGIFTVVRDLGYAQIVRETVTMIARIEELDAFVVALRSLAHAHS